MRPDGIYLDLSFEEYLAEPRLSSSDINGLIESPSAWSVRDKRRDDAPSQAMILGSAYHCARLEPDKLEERFVRDLVPEDLGPDLIRTDADAKMALKALDLPQTSKDDGDMIGRAHRLLAAFEERGIDTPIWHFARAEFEASLNGRVPIPPDHWEQMLADGDHLRALPEVARLFENGAPEVSIFWTDEDTGVRLKARPDYILATGETVHLKTWDAKSNKPANRAIRDLFMYSNYYRTGWFYEMAAAAARDQGLPIEDIGKADTVERWADDPKNPDTWFVFQRRGGIPDVRARKINYYRLPPGVAEQSIDADTAGFRREMSSLARKADVEIRLALRTYLENVEIYGFREWYPRDLVGEWDDSDFNGFWLDGVDEAR